MNHAPNFFVASDHRVEFALSGKLREIAAILLQCFVSSFRILIGDALAAAHLLQRAHQPLARDAELTEQFACRSRIVGKRQQNVLHRSEIVLEPLGFVFRLRYDFR